VEITKAVKLKPEYSEAYYNLGLIYRDQGDNSKALSAFTSSLKYETNAAYAEDTRRCIRDLSAPHTANEHLEKGYDWLERSEWKKAQKEFEEAIAAGGSNNAIAWNNLGLSQANQGHYQEARHDYQKAIDLKGGVFAAAQYNLGQAYRDLGKPDQAEKCFRQAIKDGKGTHALAYNALGTLLKQKGDLKGAVRSYKLAVLQSGDTLPVVHFNLGMALEKMESSRDAAREYRVYLSQSPQGLNAERARARLHRLGIDVP
jgi:tetratricopeptide (TPR) repeat protein